MGSFMDVNPVEAYVIMETEGPWVKPEVKKVVETANDFWLTFNTVLQTFDTWNRNGRNYVGKVMAPALEAPHLVELRKRKSWTGENGHPNTKVPEEVLQIDPKKICHKIDSYNITGNTLRGQITTLNDDLYGRQMTKHILQGMEVAFSLRALAALTKIDARRTMVQSPPHIVTYDRVILPSHCEAYQDTSQPIKVGRPNMSNYVSEGTAIKLSEMDAQRIVRESAANFCAEESTRVKNIIKFFDVAYESIGMSQDGKSVFIKDINTNNTYNVILESYVENQISDIFRTL